MGCQGEIHMGDKKKMGRKKENKRQMKTNKKRRKKRASCGAVNVPSLDLGSVMPNTVINLGYVTSKGIKGDRLSLFLLEELRFAYESAVGALAVSLTALSLAHGPPGSPNCSNYHWSHPLLHNTAGHCRTN
jgi:hypothetical protein